MFDPLFLSQCLSTSLQCMSLSRSLFVHLVLPLYPCLPISVLIYVTININVSGFKWASFRSFSTLLSCVDFSRIRTRIIRVEEVSTPTTWLQPRPNCLYECLSLFLSLHMRLNVCIHQCVSTMSLFVCMFVHLFLFLCLPISVSMYVTINVSQLCLCLYACLSITSSLSLSLFVYLFFHFCSTQTRKRDWAFLRIFVNLLIAIFCLKMVETLPTDDSVQSERCTVTLSQIKKRRKLFIKWWLFWLSRPLLSVNIPKTCLHKCGISFDHRLML